MKHSSTAMFFWGSPRLTVVALPFKVDAYLYVYNQYIIKYIHICRLIGFLKTYPINQSSKVQKFWFSLAIQNPSRTFRCFMEPQICGTYKFRLILIFWQWPWSPWDFLRASEHGGYRSKKWASHVEEDTPQAEGLFWGPKKKPRSWS